MERVYSFPPDSQHHHCFTKDTDIKRHGAYQAAKAGDFDAALELVEDLASDFLAGIKSCFPSGMNFVSPYAREATGDNALPLVLSLECARKMSGKSDTDVVQVQKVFHTGADPMERLMLRPSFEGQVTPGALYVLVDDVTSMGGTLAELANFVLLKGGKIAGSVVLVNAGRSKRFSPVKKHIQLLEDRFGDEINEIFGIHTTALTANEASYLVGFRSADEIRNRCLKAEKETALRLLSKKDS